MQPNDEDLRILQNSTNISYKSTVQYNPFQIKSIFNQKNINKLVTKFAKHFILVTMMYLVKF